LISAIATIIFVAMVQWQTIHHLKLRANVLTLEPEIDLMVEIAKNTDDFAAFKNTDAYKASIEVVDNTLMAFEHSGMWYVTIFYF